MNESERKRDARAFVGALRPLVEMTARQKLLARCFLGLPNKDNRSYRNRFFCPDGENLIDALVHRGWARKFNERGMYVLTTEGATLALEQGETLDSEDFPDA